MDIYRLRAHEPNAKEKFQEKFRKLYGKEEVQDEDEKDEKYKQLIETLTRIKQQLGSQQQALSNLVMRVNNLIEKKNRREVNRNNQKAAAAASHTSKFSKVSSMLMVKGADRTRDSKKSSAS